MCLDRKLLLAFPSPGQPIICTWNTAARCFPSYGKALSSSFRSPSIQTFISRAEFFQALLSHRRIWDKMAFTSTGQMITCSTTSRTKCFISQGKVLSTFGGGLLKEDDSGFTCKGKHVAPVFQVKVRGCPGEVKARKTFSPAQGRYGQDLAFCLGTFCVGAIPKHALFWRCLIQICDVGSWKWLAVYCPGKENSYPQCWWYRW